MATNKQILSKQILQELGVISVDLETEIISRYNKRGNKILSTKPTISAQKNSKKCPNKVSYNHRIVCIRGKTYSYSNIVYAWFVGPIPSGFLIDHIDGNTSNNNPNNLRLYTQQENLQNNHKRREKIQKSCIDE